MGKTAATAKPYVAVFSVTLFISAFLLFSIQPLFGKMVLPLLGGAPMVWNTAMLFYQAVLLAGYAYAHLTSRYMGLKSQAILHLVLFGAFAFILPFFIDKAAIPPVDPSKLVTWQIILMGVTIGGPFFVLSGCAPMLQYWFSKSGHKDAGNPYFLYSASNAGSMIALLCYPFIFEPKTTVPEQSLYWSYGYYALIALIALSVAFVWNSHKKSQDPAMQPLDKKTEEKVKPDMRTRLVWLALAFLPSSLMLGVTTHISTDLAAFPLLWVIPLALYVGTFIIVFSKREWITLEKIQQFQFYFLIILVLSFIGDIIFNRVMLIALHFGTFFMSALLCHKHLERLKPHPHYLTEFFLFMSIGGVLGGIFNTLIAPVVFVLPVEYGLVLVLTAFARHMDRKDQALTHAKEQLTKVENMTLLGLTALFITCIQIAYLNHYASVIMVSMMGICVLLVYMEKRRWVFAISALAVVFTSQFFFRNSTQDLLLLDRNYFGVMRAYDNHEHGVRLYMNGTTLHGAQPLDASQQLTPISYYSNEGPSGNVFDLLRSRHEPQNIAAVGLGIGSVACFTAPGRHFDFYEINPAVKDIAEDKELFTYLSDCGSPYEVILGDARLKMEQADDHEYDMVFLDAFSSDNIPIHLITKEAFALYFQKLKDDGFIVVHISNRFMDLRPLVNALADSNNATALFKNQTAPTEEEQESEKTNYRIPAIYSLMARDPAVIQTLKQKYGWKEFDGPAIPVWTDNFADPVHLLLNSDMNALFNESAPAPDKENTAKTR